MKVFARRQSILLVSVITLCACSGDTQLKTEVDSLRAQIASQQEQLTNCDAFINLVNTALDSIVSVDGNKIIGTGEISTREQIKNNLDAYQQILDNYKAKIDDLTQKLAETQGVQANSMKEAVSKLKDKLSEKLAEISELRGLVENKNISISQLSKEVNNLSKNVAELSNLSKKQAEELQNKDEMINTAYYLLGTKKELKALGILSKSSLFSKSKVDLSTSEIGKFNKIDIRDQQTFHIPSKNAKILTPIPPGTYTMDISGNSCTLNIIDVNKFWSVSHYLVIEY